MRRFIQILKKRTAPFVKDASAAQTAFEESATQFGGIEAVLGRCLRVNAMVRIAKGAALMANLNDPGSETLISVIEALRPEAGLMYEAWQRATKDAYISDKNFDVIKEVNPEGSKEILDSPIFQKIKKERQRFTDVQKNTPGQLLLGKIPPASLRTWRQLDQARKQALIKREEQWFLWPIIQHHDISLKAKYPLSTMTLWADVLKFKKEAGLEEIKKQQSSSPK